MLTMFNQGVSVKDIAEAYGVTRPLVTKSLQRARGKA